MTAPIAFDDWFARIGWVYLAIVCAVLFIAVFGWWIANAADGPEDEATCPEVDLDTELRRLIETEGTK